MVKKAVVFVVIGVLVGMSVFPSTGTLVSEKPVNTAGQKTNGAPAFWETVSQLGFQTRTLERTFVSPGINFPLPGEIFRVGDVVEINGTASLPEFQNFILEWGVGLSPTEWFTTGVALIANGSVEIMNATLGFWDTGAVTEAGYYTIKLTVHLTDSGQYSVNVSIYLDPTLHLNFPFGWRHGILGSQVAIWSPIALSDINSDGYQEIGFGTVTVVPAGDNNYDYVLDHNGNVLQGWPLQMYSIQGASLTFADIDRSTSTEEVVGGMWGDDIFVWHDDGTVVDGWPKPVAASRSSAAVIDLDGDGDLEIILPSTDGGGKIYALHHDGTMVDGWPVTIGSPLRSAVATADIDRDGFPEIVCGDQNGYVHAFHHDGSVVDGWPQQAHDFIKSSPVIADLEGDGDLEVLICSGFTEQRIISAWHHDGTMVAGWPVENGLSFAQPSVADLDGDGDLEILSGGAIPDTPYGRFYVWHHDGTVVDGWPITFAWDWSQYLDYIYAQPVVGDIDGDADVEIIAGSYAKKLYAWHHDATNVTGWPKRIGDAVDATAAIADIDNDALVEVAVAGDDGKIYVWDMPGIYNSSHMEWPLFQYDRHHTGCYGSVPGSNQPPAAPTITGPAKGKIKVATEYNFTTVDPEGDMVYYFIDWGDSSNSSWIGPAPSGDVVPQSHTWSKKGTYIIKAKAKDIYGNESDWGTLSVTMPCSYNIPFQQFWELLFERFPNAFPIVRHLMGY
ncbi:MAG TPA: FG-GAP-like repeat-containing protein [Candidatus Thermoplasmatota archaeon]|nr:FG-GAP-like repeat-containing protein [Candidatus Thermoplasmatota archaeon]